MRKGLIYFAFLTLLLFPQIASAFSTEENITAFDTISGFDTLVKVEQAYPGQEFLFRIFTPDKRKFNVRGVSSDQGVFRQEIPSTILNDPGLYQVSVLSGDAFVGSSEFSVYSDEPLDIGGDTEPLRFLTLADTQSGASSFEIKNLPSSIAANQTTSFTLRALDNDLQVVRDYRGTVHFSSSTDQNALVPEDYTFQASDLGEHTFQLSLSFRQTGTQKLIVEEVDNPDIKGEAEIIVTAQRAVASVGTLRISRPSPGRYGVNIVQIEGDAPQNSTVTMLDNDQQIGVTRSSQTGNFLFTSPVLADGVHRLKASSGSLTSDEVVIDIDTKVGKVSDVTLSKNPTAPGDTIDITAKTDPGLKNVSLVVADILVDLTEESTEPGTYRGQIIAPEESGSYPLDVRTLDESGNEGLSTEIVTLRVDENLSSRISFRVPSRVANIRAIPGEGKVTLTWSPAQDDTGIASYRIYHGIGIGNLNRIVNTVDARTEWYVPNLQPGVQYYFQVVGVDTDGNEGDQRSSPVGAVVLGTTAVSSSASSRTRFGDLGNAGGVAPPPENLPQDGPEVLYLFGISPLLAAFFRKKWQKK